MKRISSKYYTMIHHWKGLELEFSDIHDWTTTAGTFTKLRKIGFFIPSDTVKKTFYT